VRHRRFASENRVPLVCFGLAAAIGAYALWIGLQNDDEPAGVQSPSVVQTTPQRPTQSQPATPTSRPASSGSTVTEVPPPETLIRTQTLTETTIQDNVFTQTTAVPGPTETVTQTVTETVTTQPPVVDVPPIIDLPPLLNETEPEPEL
jgi:hypothetical protein